ncbi:MAG: gluconate 2-dehydrogenase subunit 3 family protein [Bacteroidota bacterium]|nr:gluconate 2-dehydrogenase subunit 3 family protein [Bacteroidota bacterium]
MKRREAFKNLSLFVCGTLTIPASSLLNSCSPSSKKIDWNAKYLNEDEAFFLNELSNTIIPNTELPGALAVGVPTEIEDYVFNVFEDDKIENFRDELNQLDDHLNNSDREKTFYESSLQEKTDILNKLQESNKETHRDIYLKIKSSVATSYFRSEVGATQILRYNGPSVVLGNYKGCIPLEEVGKTWAI